jgi:uncharacterized membrane protein YraQ (UPF0718 family)
MISQINFIINYIIESFFHIWPYLLITIPIAVAVQMSGMSRYIRKVFSARPILAILLATIVGAFSPLCSCSVIPVIAALLIGGVPLAPVMSFWLASPSMDPEIFFLTVGTLGWELAVMRLGGTLLLSLGGGFIVHFTIRQGWLGDDLLRKNHSTRVKTFSQVIKTWGQAITNRFSVKRIPVRIVQPAVVGSLGGCGDVGNDSPANCQLSMPIESTLPIVSPPTEKIPASECNSTQTGTGDTSCQIPSVDTSPSFIKRLGHETWLATKMVIKFMVLAWLIGALVRLYVPELWISNALGVNNAWAIIAASLLGVPVYTSNLAAMPLVGGLLDQGMNPAAALAFLISGPITTLPAMSAVWGLVNRKVFALYIGFALFGAVLLGYLYELILVF